MRPTRSLVLETIRTCPAYMHMSEGLPNRGDKFVLGGAVGSSSTVSLAALHQDHPGRVFLAVADTPSHAAAIEADLEALLGPDQSRLYPQREGLSSESDEPNLELSGMRIEVIEALFGGRLRLIVTTLRALQELAPIPANLAGLRLTVSVGQELGFNTLIGDLEARGFERVPVVEAVGQYAVRGGILDLFSFGAAEPVRTEFWGDEVVSIRSFDILDQRSSRDLTEVHILPVELTTGPGSGEISPRSLLELLPSDAVLVQLGRSAWEASMEKVWRGARTLFDELKDHGRAPRPPEEMFLAPAQAIRLSRGFANLVMRESSEGTAVLKTALPPPIERDMKRLAAVLREAAATGFQTLLLCDNEGQAHRLEEILGSGAHQTLPPGAQVGVGSVDRGFILEDSFPPLQVLVDHQIFRRSRRVRRARKFRGAVALESLAQLAPGDYVVHMDHGIGRFVGLDRVTVGGLEIESLAIEYAGQEILRVPVYRLDLVERWVGDVDEDRPPTVHRIGGKKWKTLKKKTEAAIEEMTAELLQLYAQRELATGTAFGPDTVWQKEMESSFLYEDTPDQRQAAEDVKRDMASSKPMDRLVCGDVGYGKTEVAVRAAFKAVQAGKQVAVLAPTTILVEQHRHTFEERLADYPVRVGALSRFRGAKESKELLERLETGAADIVIGTHRLLSPDVRFHDLGLLIIDEEQRFGVKHKEKLKQLRASVDVLTLTATPIPRTLYLSLASVRDLSIIRTPPRDRMPIITNVLPWSEGIVSEAIHRELDRGGQAFFLHNLVETIDTAAERIRQLVPEARIGIAHGQMSGPQLDKVMTAFVDGDLDVLVCSSIIENGLDVPNANTLIVDRADRFGLAQLYQIRGRVGRSDRRAYCYLIVPDGVNPDAEKRLRVLEHYTELGSGYAVALRDLEMRGAGNLLGGQQSGFANAVGIDAYLRLLETTVQRMRDGKSDEKRADPEISMEGSTFLPDSYVPDSGQKLHLYRRLSKLAHRSEIQALREELADRFGALPPEVGRLLDSTALRILGRRVGVERILLRDKKARINFHAGVVPKLQILDRPLRDRQVVVEVRRMSPLSLALTSMGPEPLGPTVVRALEILGEEQANETGAA